jgi:hypothetical protein
MKYYIYDPHDKNYPYRGHFRWVHINNVHTVRPYSSYEIAHADLSACSEDCMVVNENELVALLI